MSRLGELGEQVRRQGPGGLPPISNSEELELIEKGDHDAVNRLDRERLEQGIALRGLALIAGIMEGCVDHGVEFVANTRARELTIEDGRVVGLVAEQEGTEVEYRARLGVVLASGGFEWNRDMWAAFMGVPWDGAASPPFNEGDAIVMAARAGAKLGNLDKATGSQRALRRGIPASRTSAQGSSGVSQARSSSTWPGAGSRTKTSTTTTSDDQ